MTFWSELFATRHLISRTFYATGVQTITAPARSAFIRACGVGAGGIGGSNFFGHGAAFARVKTTCSPGDQFSIQVGGPGTPNGDTKVTKVTGSVLILKAEAGQGTTAPGDAANCIGDVKRSGGSASVFSKGGSSAGDDADPYPLGFGGRGASLFLAPAPGGGGAGTYTFGGTSNSIYIPVGYGRLCIEFFDADPATVLPGSYP